MSREENVDPPQPGDEPELPPARPHDPIDDPMNPKSVPSLPATESQPGKLPKWIGLSMKIDERRVRSHRWVKRGGSDEVTIGY